ncbi:unnamed protein product [Heligmosomoides polygyrus]|uniref:ShKT domain-containing protein n=1 Tax=Heligmosomoides polygyrus TaxID=6339 RepID=A0A183G6L3_HELPZ|nr:unnamed protein product [Heligmosomoides polygyrus]
MAEPCIKAGQTSTSHTVVVLYPTMLVYFLCVLLLVNAFTATAEECKDRSKACQKHLENGRCDSEDPDWQSLMKMNCRKTCSYCTEGEN